MNYTADFETTTIESDCRVWAWGVCEIGNTDNFTYNNTLDSFMEFCENSNNSNFYFHNLKFDGAFILCWLFEHGFKHVTERKKEQTQTFSTLISDKGQFYSIKIVFKKQGKKTKYVKIYDSLKILPFSAAQIAKGFNLPFQKLELDYTTFRPVGHVLTETEISYLYHDVKIVAAALDVLFKQNLTKMTQGSNALFDYKNTVGEKTFSKWFPLPKYDKDVRQSYKGGFTYLSPRYKNKDITTGLVFDVNSLYPWVMRECSLPFGEPIYFNGEYKPDKLYNMYIQMFSCEFEIKKGYIPTIQLKNNLSFMPTEYITDSGGQTVTMCLTSVDFELFKAHYHVYNLEFHGGYKFKSATGLFNSYIDKWIKVKNESTINGNKAMRTLAKLMLNALYGKFATSPEVCSKIPFYDNGVVKYRKGEKESKDPVYIPVGTFITAWARHKTITNAQKLYKYFVYADTDSLHLSLDLSPEILKLNNKEIEHLTTEDLKKYGIELPEDFEIDPVKLGAWKCESRFYRARFIRQKTYIEDWNTPETWNTDNYNNELLNITCAGMPQACYQYVTWENFKEGATYQGKLQPKNVKGGIILKDIEFTIQHLTR